MSAPIPLTVIQGGISRLRTKGAALRNSLYNLTNAYVTAGKTVHVRPGTYRRATLANTKGLTWFSNNFHVFSDTSQSLSTGYVDNVLSNPQNRSSTVSRIHFAAQFMGFLYVVAEFSDGTIQHFWLQNSGTWKANTVYFNGDFILPTTLNGFAYAATRLVAPHPVWAPNVAVAVNDIYEPTVYNGYMFKAITVVGDSPHTGSTEPAWPVVENAQLQEFGDFSSSTGASNDTSSTTPTPGKTITDRYGNASVFNSSLNASVTTDAPPTAAATVTTWLRGTLYQPGAVVRPSTSQGAFIDAIPNGDFEAGDDGSWLLPGGSNLTILLDASKAYQGTHVLQATLNRQTSRASMATPGTVIAGQSVTATCYANPNNSGANLTFKLNLAWYDAGSTLISRTQSAGAQGAGYRQVTVTGNAPSNATGVRVELEFATGTVPAFAYADIVSWNLETPASLSNFLFEAIQTSVATSGTTEPVWPAIEGGTVVDGGVTWEAIGTSIITWQAVPIMKSGSSEPTFPTIVGNAVSDGTMSWVAADRAVSGAPHSIVVAIGASKVFAADNDIIRFCATTNCLDWTTENDAGFIPFGLQTYGSESCAMIGLYRSNLVAFNSLGYQMWQIDEDPANMALLDASAVGSSYVKSGQPVQNDFTFLTAVGYRSIGIAGASTNLQAGQFGKQIDPLVKASIATGRESRALFYPGTGQYWGFFDTNAGSLCYVLTLNGSAADQSWSTYQFPENITDWTIRDGVLWLRTENDHVWELSESALYDDIVDANTHVAFTGVMTWPFLDLGTVGLDKDLEGIDLVCTGSVTVRIGYDQRNFSTKTPDYAISGDTLPNVGIIPFPLTAPSYQFELEFSAGQAWEWEALNVYLAQSTDT